MITIKWLDRQNSVSPDILSEGRFTDAVIRLREFELDVHKVVLSSASGYFSEHFKSNYRVYNLEEENLKLDELDAILTFIYTGKNCKNC